MTIYDNVALSPRLRGISNRDELNVIVERCLRRAALWDEVKARLKSLGSLLSGGQQQRAAIARTLVQKSDIILADEPVASLDPAAADKVMKTLTQINQEDNATIIISLHQIEYALKYCTRIIALKGGELIFDGSSGDTSPDFFTDLYGGAIDMED